MYKRQDVCICIRISNITGAEQVKQWALGQVAQNHENTAGNQEHGKGVAENFSGARRFTGTSCHRKKRCAAHTEPVSYTHLVSQKGVSHYTVILLLIVSFGIIALCGYVIYMMITISKKSEKMQLYKLIELKSQEQERQLEAVSYTHLVIRRISL